MSVRTWNFGPSEGESRPWKFQEVEAYHRQCIAVSLERIAGELARLNRFDETWYNRFTDVEAALLLMSERDEVVSWFSDGDSMRLSEFVERAHNAFGWSALHGKPVEAINKTHYLRAERKGGGYRVWLVRD